MIYLDNSATTYPKPIMVTNAVNNAMKKYSANPGRSGHNMSMASANEIYNCRKTAAKLFSVENAENVIFTLNCTQAINIVLKGLLKPNDNVVLSCLEHNAVLRPLYKLKEIGITTTAATVYPGNNDKTLNSFRDAINSKTKLIVCIHASNVWGIRLPVERLAALAHQYGIPILVDAAQSAGLFPIDFEDSNIDYLCIAGHKGLYGPMGTGMLITKHGENLDTLVEGGTGTNSISPIQPDFMPDRFESGTPNMSGIAGLKAGMEFVMKKKPENILIHENKLIIYLYERLLNLEKVKLYMPKPDIQFFAPLLSFNIEGMQSEEVSLILNQNNIAVRAGLHCSPDAHEFAGTLDTGAVRICPSVFNKKSDIDKLLFVLCKKIIKAKF